MHCSKIGSVRFNANLALCTQRSLTTSTKPTPGSIPISKGLPLIGNLFALLQAGGAPHLHRYIDKRHRQYGPVFKERLSADVNAVFISDPEVMRAVFAKEGKHPVHVLPEAWTLYSELYGCARGLFFMNGQEWQHHRRIMNNFLLKTGANIQEAVEVTAGSLKLQNWEHNLEEALYRWSLDTIIAVMLGKSQYLECKVNLDTKLEDIASKVKLIFETSASLQLVPARLAHKLKLRVWKDFVRALGNALSDASDLTYMLMAIMQKPCSSSMHNVGVISLMTEAQMAPSDIIKIIVDLILAAGDTTAYTMQWILYLLAKNPQYQNCIDPSDIKNIVREALRLYPVAPFITRINTEESIEAGNYIFPKNSLLIYSLYTVGRDSKYFKNPLLFMPERWKDKTPQMTQAALPFAMGARSCIGRRIAELQLVRSLYYVLKGYTIQLKEPNTNIDMVLKMVSVPSNPIQLRFIKK